ncbi:hypothetical protein Vadar_024015 [Vaccinium darrowii]|uniref:Uncharacterized protein n=1 Tax=Vaccinium darrowii TaxID=229202 RepID=A0ACB7XCJ4_9ERIC|nr:hypothetical protein Vadar_024015 [Vaccinium darrowii]
MEHVISRGPWLIRGGVLVLDYWHFYDHLGMIRVRWFHIWVQLHNLPFEAFTREAGEIMGLALGGDVTVDVDDVEPCSIECRYERVYKVCRACGRIGHTYLQCDLSREDANKRVDDMLNGLCERFGSVLHTNVNEPLYTNCIRAFTRSNACRNTHMWAVRGESTANTHVAPVYQVVGHESNHGGRHFGLEGKDHVEEGIQTDAVSEHLEVTPVAVDLDQFIENYEVTWEWGLQRSSSGFFQ